MIIRWNTKCVLRDRVSQTVFLMRRFNVFRKIVRTFGAYVFFIEIDFNWWFFECFWSIRTAGTHFIARLLLYTSLSAYWSLCVNFNLKVFVSYLWLPQIFHKHLIVPQLNYLPDHFHLFRFMLQGSKLKNEFANKFFFFLISVSKHQKVQRFLILFKIWINSSICCRFEKELLRM